MPRYSLAQRVAAAKRFGLTVEVVPGAETRGSDSYYPGCYVGHHTGGPNTGDRPSLNIVVNGRSDLSGPLANDFMPRAGGLVIVACGRSNNAGLGAFRGILGNSGTMACEAEDDGDGLWTPEQKRDYPRIVASGLYLMGRDASWYCSHRTWALLPPSWPGRKVDPAGITDADMQREVAALLKAGGPTEEIDVPLVPADANVLLAGKIEIPTQYQKEYARAVYTLEELLFSAQYHAQEGHQQLAAFVAASTARETALVARVGGLVDLVTKLAQSNGVPISRDEIVQTLDAAVARGFTGLDLHIVPTAPALPAGPTA